MKEEVVKGGGEGENKGEKINQRKKIKINSGNLAISLLAFQLILPDPHYGVKKQK